ncbi:hypothetical protein K504DRAFT_467220 [Pleomassaria siparia CBS 279.74]|uniref:F-box domain-containing protein n=1 Tax=Pleomassaria siparia CBS 279.74 TaxID=1314801 RepID=A0A6G1K8W0_9PLEO|nr:hypothetical protein K504DRAFT_467220 [Pleomassaria siparia CBS 279.74]
MVTLLSLPRELRDHILYFAIFESSLYPSPGPQIRGPHKQNDSNIHYLLSQICPCWAVLMLVNHQIHAETQHLLSIKNRGYQLDLAFIDGDLLWPKSRFLPPRMTGGILESMDINIILCHTRTSYSKTTGSLFRSSSARELRMILMIKSYLAHFLKACNRKSDEWQASHAVIKSLRLNIDTESQGNDHVVSHDEVPGRLIVGWAGSRVNHPLYRYDKRVSTPFVNNSIAFIQEELRIEHNVLRSNPTFFSLVGDMIFSVDGQDRENLDTANELAADENDDEILAEFKRVIRENRKKFGLSI